PNRPPPFSLSDADLAAGKSYYTDVERDEILQSITLKPDVDLQQFFGKIEFAAHWYAREARAAPLHETRPADIVRRFESFLATLDNHIADRKDKEAAPRGDRNRARRLVSSGKRSAKLLRELRADDDLLGSLVSAAEGLVASVIDSVRVL